MSDPTHPHSGGDQGGGGGDTYDPTAGDEAYFDDSEEEWDAPARGELTAAADTGSSPARGTREIDYAAMGGEESELAGAKVAIVFTFPNGSHDAPIHRQFVMGITVAHLKAFLEDTIGLPYDRVSLYLNQGSYLLLDPLSLNDCPFEPAVENEVRVIVAAA